MGAMNDKTLKRKAIAAMKRIPATATRVLDRIEAREDARKAATGEGNAPRFPEAFNYTNLQFNSLPGWARDTILALEARNAELLAALKELKRTAARGFDDIREFGSLRPPNGFEYRRANEAAQTAIANSETRRGEAEGRAQ